MKRFAVLALVLLAFGCSGQQYNYYINGFLQMPNAAAARGYLGITNSGGGGSTGVTNFSITGLSPLFNASVSNPTFWPSVSFIPISQTHNVVFAGPAFSGSGNPTFRALIADDIPQLTLSKISDAGNVASINLDGNNTHYLDGSGNFSVPSGSGGGVSNPYSITWTNAGQYLTNGKAWFLMNADGSWIFSNAATASARWMDTNGNIFTRSNINYASIFTTDGNVFLPTNEPGRGNFYGQAVSVNVISNNVPDVSPFIYGDWTVEGQFEVVDKFFADAGIDASGETVAAGNFTGDGSALTSLTAGNISGVIPPANLGTGTMDATHFLNGLGQFAPVTGGGGGPGGIDLAMTNILAYDGQTNFAIDFNYPAQVMVSTGSIYFNYSTNWGLSSTSRVANVYIPPTNYLRHVYFVNAATNWQFAQRSIAAVPTGYGAKLSFQLYGVGETNVICIPNIDSSLATSNSTAAFNPTNQGGLKLWLDASTGVCYDEYFSIPAFDGCKVRGWKDLSGFLPGVTNNASDTQLFYRNPNSSPGNIPCLNVAPGTTWLDSPSFTALSQPLWVFIMFYGRGGDNPQVDGAGSANRIDCTSSETPAHTCQLFCTGGVSVNFTPPVGLAWRLFSYNANGSSSSIRTNGIQAATGNPGTATVSAFHIATDYQNTASVSDNYIAEIQIYQTNLTLVQVTNIENYFRLKYGGW